ncbi:MAG: hypothetical protein HY319_06720 [Armatimonadetes bacterium]|nr:hypothetical protein [Armatimonadota bacterium]
MSGNPIQQAMAALWTRTWNDAQRRDSSRSAVGHDSARPPANGSSLAGLFIGTFQEQSRQPDAQGVGEFVLGDQEDDLAPETGARYHSVLRDYYGGTSRCRREPSLFRSRRLQQWLLRPPAAAWA